MQLRNTILTPIRFGEEHHNNDDALVLSHRPHREHKNTTPAYPLLLRRIVVDYQPTLYPAAFPSESFAAPLLDTRDKENQQPSEGELALQQSPREPTLNGFAHRSLEDEKSSHGLHDVASDSEAVKSPTLHLDRTHDMQTSPQRVMPDELGEVEIVWSMLDEGLQMFIYDSLMSQVKHPVRAAVALGLTVQELHNIAHLSNLRQIHPATVNQLWAHCGTGNPAYVDPKVLSQYIGYMNFAAICDWRDSASDYQKRLAIRFVRQRKIEGLFVDDLLDDLNGIFIRPETADNTQLHSVGEEDDDKDIEEEDRLLFNHRPVTGHEALRWHDICGSTSVHDSHNLDAVAMHFKCCYFPESLCKEMLVKPKDILNSWELWLVYGVQANGLGVVSDADFMGTVTTFKMYLPLSCLLTLHRKYVETQANIHEVALLNEVLHLCLHSAIDTVRQNGNVHKKVQQMPLTTQEKSLVFASVAEHVMASTNRDLKNDMLLLELSQASSSSQEEISGESNTSAEALSRRTSGGNESPFSRAQTSSPRTSLEPDTRSERPPSLEFTDSGHASIHNGVGSSPGRNKPRSETLSTNATLPVAAEYINAGPVELSNGIDHAARLAYNPYAISPARNSIRRSSSTSSFHTARDEHEDLVMISPPRPALASVWFEPERPPVSPISDWDAMEVDERDASVNYQSAYTAPVRMPGSPTPEPRHEAGPKGCTRRDGQHSVLNGPTSLLLNKKSVNSKAAVLKTRPQHPSLTDSPAYSKNSAALPRRPMLILKMNTSRALAQNAQRTPTLLAGINGAAPIANTPLAPSTSMIHALSQVKATSNAPLPVALSVTKPSPFPSTPLTRPVPPDTSPAHVTSNLQENKLRHAKNKRSGTVDSPKALAPKPFEPAPGLTSTPSIHSISKMMEGGAEAVSLPENQSVLEFGQPKQKSPRKDKGKKRGPYNTRKRKAGAATAEAEAAVSVIRTVIVDNGAKSISESHTKKRAA